MFNSIIKKIYSNLRYFYHILLWKYDSKKLRKEIENYLPKPKHSKLEGKILILAPHSDDEWIGGFSFIENNDCVILHMDMIGDNDDETRLIRFQETSNIATRYGRKLIKCKSNKVEYLKSIINEIKPKYIALPFLIDWHPEHLDTINMLCKAMNSYACHIIMYQVSCPLPSIMVNYAIPLNRKEWVQKWAIFKDYYKTQKGFPWRRFALIERAEGGYTNSYAANVYCVCDSDKWVKMLKNLPSGETIRELKSNLNHIYINKKFIDGLVFK